MSDPASRFHTFSGHRLDTLARQLQAADGSVLPLTAKAFDVLLHLLEHRERVVGKEELLEAVWPGRIIEENNLTQAVSAIRRALGVDAADRRYLVTVPGRGYRFVATVEDPAPSDATRHPSAVIDPAAGRTASPALHSMMRWRLFWGALALLAVLLTTLALRERPPRTQAAADSSTPPVTLAVLPFRSIGGEEGDPMLELGMAETLIARLSRSTSLRVLSLGSVQRFTGKTIDPARTGMSLGADYVIEGSVQRHGDLIRVNARLLSLPDGHSRWAGTFDQTPARVFTLQDALATELASALPLRLSVGVPHASGCDGADANAYRAYLRGRHLMYRPERNALPEAIASFRQAIAHDPQCARAWAATAFAYRAMVMTADADPREVFPLAKQAVQHALAIDPASAEAYASKGFIEFWYDWDWAAAEISLRHAIGLNDNLSESHFALAHLLVNTGRSREALPHARKAMLLDPLSPIINTIGASFFFAAGQTQEAKRRLDKVLDTDPDFWVALMMRGLGRMERDDRIGGLADLTAARAACTGCSHAEAALARAYVQVGDRAAAERILADLEQRSRSGYFPSTRLALLYLAMDRREQALDALERAYQQRDVSMSFLAVDGRWRSLHREPRFTALLQRMDLALSR